jgi:hypothetical protein
MYQVFECFLTLAIKKKIEKKNTIIYIFNRKNYLLIFPILFEKKK